jgi:hypothetical protein
VEPLVVSLIAFGCIFGGMIIGRFLRPRLPEHHLSAESRDVVKMGTGTIATLAALVLGLLIGSAKSNFDSASNGLVQMGSKIILLDRVLAHYGLETRETRDLLRRSVASAMGNISPDKRTEQAGTTAFNPKAGLEVLQRQLRQLSPQSDGQRWLQSRALQVSSDIADVSWLLLEQQWHRSLPRPLLGILVSWLVVIFFSFGLLAPRNTTLFVILLICALSAAGSLYMILELDRHFGGLITVSSAPLENALGQLGR